MKNRGDFMYFDKQLCMFDQEFANQDQLFQAMFNVMNDAGVVKDDYLEGIIEREKEYPTGLMVGKTGFAIPHTDSSKVNYSQICFASLQKPVCFANMGDKNEKINVEFVFMLAMSRPHEQVETLQNLIGLFQDEEAINLLKKCHDEISFMEILKERNIY